jgi:hypothetical protein
MFALALALSLSPQLTDGREIDASADLCATINSLDPGEELVLQSGDYRGPCKITRSGNPGMPLVIRGPELGPRPRIIYHGRGSSVFEIYADHLLFKRLEFGPTQMGVDGFRIFAGNDIAIEDSVFTRMGGIAIAATHKSVRGIVIRGNASFDAMSTVVYLGCHDGISCVHSDLLIERNFIQGVNAADPAIGYGIQIKLNSTAVIRDNVITDTKGPPIMVYGAEDLAKLSIVEKNFTSQSRASSGIVVGGGPVWVRNNVATQNAQAGISLDNYDKRGLLRDIVVAHNTVYQNVAGGIISLEEELRRIEIINNVGAGQVGKPLFPANQPGLRSVNNFDCTERSCFVDPASRNFTPQQGSPLLSAESAASSQWSPKDDFFGQARDPRSTVGAIVLPGGTIPLEIKR